VIDDGGKKPEKLAYARPSAPRKWEEKKEGNEGVISFSPGNVWGENDYSGKKMFIYCPLK